MFLQDASAEKSFTGLNDIVGQFRDAAAEALSPNRLAVRYAQIEDLTRKTTRNISGMFGAAADSLQKASVNAYLETLNIGASYEEVLSIQQEIATQQQKALSLTEEEVVAAVAFSKATGVAAKDVGTIVLAFADLGQSTSTALENMSNMAAEARKYGLNVGQFMSTVAKNLTLVNSYGFKNGVEGFTKMVARSQALRIDMTQTTKLASELLNPEKAIELAAEFQNLGGAIGDLGDPFKLLYMAQNDMEGLQEAVVQAAKSAVMFNKQTGEFKISSTEMYRLRAQAQALGVSYEELANTAVRAAKESEILSRLRFTGLNKETQQLVANLAEIKDGQVQIKLPGMDKAITDFSVLQNENSEEFKALKAYQETAVLSDRQIAEGQLSTLQNIANSLQGLKDVTVTTPNFQELGKAASQGLQEGFQKFTEKVSTVAQSPEYQTAVENLTTSITDGFINVFDEMEKGNFAGATAALGGMISEVAETTGVLDVFNDALKRGVKLLSEESGLSNILPKKGGDVLLGPTPNTVVSSPKGTFQLDKMDTVIAGTNLFDKSSESIKKLEFANAAEVRVGGTIQINGIQPGTIGDMLLRDPDFQSGIKNLFSKSFKEQLGTA
jgi:hypothetical protein